jgi:hypothetical protein
LVTTTQQVRRNVMAAEEGWYPDPVGKFRDRYWSGSAWTPHVSMTGEAVQDDSDVSKCEPPEANPIRQNAKNLLAYMAQNGKYAEALRRGRLSSVNLLGGSWNEYAETTKSCNMSALIAVSIDQRLEDLVEAVNDKPV